MGWLIVRVDEVPFTEEDNTIPGPALNAREPAAGPIMLIVPEIPAEEPLRVIFEPPANKRSSEAAWVRVVPAVFPPVLNPTDNTPGPMILMVFEVWDRVIFEPAISPIEPESVENVAPSVPPPEVELIIETILYPSAPPPPATEITTAPPLTPTEALPRPLKDSDRASSVVEDKELVVLPTAYKPTVCTVCAGNEADAVTTVLLGIPKLTLFAFENRTVLSSIAVEPPAAMML
jgi:hypothetical protein